MMCLWLIMGLKCSRNSSREDRFGNQLTLLPTSLRVWDLSLRTWGNRTHLWLIHLGNPSSNSLISRVWTIQLSLLSDRWILSRNVWFIATHNTLRTKPSVKFTTSIFTSSPWWILNQPPTLWQFCSNSKPKLISQHRRSKNWRKPWSNYRCSKTKRLRVKDKIWAHSKIWTHKNLPE
jgi:hypothetical protein